METTMKLTDYTWEIFDIAKANDKDIGVGKDMFIANLEQKQATYPGADHLNYAALGKAWQDLGIDEQTKQRNLYNRIVGVKQAGGHYRELCDLRAQGDRTGFERLVAEATGEE